MAHMVFKMELAIPLDANKELPAALRAVSKASDIPGLGTKSRIEIILGIVKSLKSYAVKINEGKDNVEMTVSASYHVCGHEDGTPCGVVNEI